MMQAMNADLTPGGLQIGSTGAARTGGRVPDPGSRGLARLGLLFMVGLLAIVIGFQQFGHSAAAGPGTHGGPPTGAGADAIEPPQADQALIMAKLAVKFGPVMPDPQSRAIFVAQLDGAAQSPLDRFRAAIVAGELLGNQEARTRLVDVDAKLPDDAPLKPDVAALLGVFAQPPQPLDDADAKRLIDRHGWFGQLAAVIGKSDTDPAREKLVGGGATLIAVFGVLGLLAAVAAIAGLGLFITAIVLVATGTLKPRFLPPATGGSVPIEMVCVFMAGFVGLKLVALAAAAILPASAVGPLTLGCQWGLMLIVFYPLLRGMTWTQTRDMLGLHARGRGGVLGEIWAGLLGYLAGIPVFVTGAIISVVLFFLWDLWSRASGGPPAAPPQNPVVEYFASGDVLWIILVGALATVWAPLVEEVVFRGALLRHLSGWMTPVLAAVPTALVFGLMHAYPIMLMGPVIALGFVFGCLRAWRGSLVACITAHAIHNGLIVVLMVTVVTLVG